MTPHATITDLLNGWSRGDDEARDRLIPLVLDDLRRIARRHLGFEAPGHTLQPTALVNELYLRLVNQKSVHLDDRSQFFAFATMLVRRILVDHARHRLAQKRDGIKISLSDIGDLPAAVHSPGLIDLDLALTRLHEDDARCHRVAELRIFGGFGYQEIAALLDISRATVTRDWSYARLWLTRELNPDGDAEKG
jgi:RNA polymerase sigma factor (TIGR02999 family)